MTHLDDCILEHFGAGVICLIWEYKLKLGPFTNILPITNFDIKLITYFLLEEVVFKMKQLGSLLKALNVKKGLFCLFTQCKSVVISVLNVRCFHVLETNQERLF